MSALRGHRWSGNVRELRNVVESALAMGSINLERPRAARRARRHRGDRPAVPRGAGRGAGGVRTRATCAALIETTGGNASAAARAANMDRPYLLSLLRRHGLR